MDERRIYNNDQSPVTGAVVVPLLQALITGVFCGAAAGILAVIFQPFDVSPWAAFFGVWITATLAGWLSYRGRWQRVLELIMGVDLNNSGGIGDDPEAPAPPPSAAAPPLRVELSREGGRITEFIDLPFSDRLQPLAAGLLAGRQFSQTVWTGSGQIFSRAEFEELRAAMLKRGLARWKNPGAPAQGIELTPAGRAILKRIA